MTLYDQVNQVRKAVDEGVETAKRLSGTKPMLRENTTFILTEGIERIITRLQDKYGEVSFTIAPGQDPEFWQLDIYSNSDQLFEIMETVEDILDELALREHLLCIIPLKKEDFEEILT